ncbi:MAG: tetratricopeptide repeat protein [Rhizobiaceae bacterium]
MTQKTITTEEKQAALAAVCDSEFLSSLERLKRFLTYIVEEEIAGRGDNILGKTIAQDVYDREPVEGVDSDNVVRVDARRLRQILDHYGDTVGAADPVRIYVDTGSYRPRFERVEKLQIEASGNRLKSVLVALAMFVTGTLIGLTLSKVFIDEPDNVIPDSAISRPTKTFERQAIFDKSPASLQAVNLAEQARLMMFPIFDRPRQQLVNEVFQRVIELDSDYFGGYAGAAQALGTLAIITPPGEARSTLLASAGHMSQKAIRLDPTDAWAQSARSWTEFANGNYEEAIRLARRAAELAPEDGNILDFLGSVALFSGHFSEAASAAEKGRELGATNQRFANRNIYAAASFHLKNYTDSLKSFKEVTDHGGPVSAPSIAFQAAGLNALGLSKAARKKIGELETAWPNVNLDTMLRGIYKDPKHAEEVLDHLVSLGWTAPNPID